MFAKFACRGLVSSPDDPGKLIAVVLWDSQQSDSPSDTPGWKHFCIGVMKLAVHIV
ncbi:hypothetical protein RE6C_01032 [Rhodopirellula europaea 6C]|uniref:Uncharacterized protein n=1 Tax=Rhodopirellula europaea 6C TaxID=1263867 RepID=M2B937_9BACT|nr:hypothetical protein RE6C_01032 [Rhodopirellula europaea 6C]